MTTWVWSRASSISISWELDRTSDQKLRLAWPLNFEYEFDAIHRWLVGDIQVLETLPYKRCIWLNWKASCFPYKSRENDIMNPPKPLTQFQLIISASPALPLLPFFEYTWHPHLAPSNLLSTVSSPSYGCVITSREMLQVSLFWGKKISPESLYTYLI